MGSDLFSWPISTRPGTKHSWLSGIQICSKEGPRPLPRRVSNEIAKIDWRNLKDTRPISTKLRAEHYWVKRIQVCWNEGSYPFPKEDKMKIVKYKKSSSPEPLCQFQPNLTWSILGWKGLKFIIIKDHFNSQNRDHSLNQCYSIIIDLNWFLVWAMCPTGLLFYLVNSFWDSEPPLLIKFFVKYCDFQILWRWKRSPVLNCLFIATGNRTNNYIDLCCNH